jgi:hypothetical protein
LKTFHEQLTFQQIASSGPRCHTPSR